MKINLYIWFINKSKTKYMKMVDKFKGTHYMYLSDEQINSLSNSELINKLLSDDIDEIIKYNSKMKFMKKNFFGSLFLTLLSFISFGYIGFIFLVPTIFFSFMFFKRKSNLLWSIKSLKVTVAAYRGNGDFLKKNDFIFDNQLNRLNDINIGELYDAISQKN